MLVFVHFVQGMQMLCYVFAAFGRGEMGWKIRSPCQIRVWRQTTFWLVCSLWPLEYICHCRCLFFACHGSTWSQVKRRCCSSRLAFHLNIDNKSQLLECTQCKNSFKLLKVSFTTFHLYYYFFPSSHDAFPTFHNFVCTFYVSYFLVRPFQIILFSAELKWMAELRIR